MRTLFAILALAFALHAEDARPVCAGGAPPPDQTNCRHASEVVSLATVEQLQAKVAEQSKQIAEIQRQNAQYQGTAQDLAYAFRGCKDTLIEMSAKPRPSAPDAKEKK